MLRVRLYRVLPGPITGRPDEITQTLLDVPLQPERWTKQDDAAFAHLERWLEPTRGGASEVTPVRPGGTGAQERSRATTPGRP